MTSFAKIGLNSKVIEVLSVHNNVLKDSNEVEQEINGIDFLTKLTGYSLWIQTSYNTHCGVHYGQDGQPDGGVALRGNYAGIGFIYDSDNDVFYSPQPYPSWNLNKETCLWESPIPRPEGDDMYLWDEQKVEWVKQITG